MDIKKKVDQLRSAIEDELFSSADYNAASELVDQVVDAGFSGLSSTHEQWAGYLTAMLDGDGTVFLPSDPLTRSTTVPARLSRAGRSARTVDRVRMTRAATGPYAAILRNIRGLSATGRGTSAIRNMSDRNVRVALAGGRARLPGTLNVTNGLDFDDNENRWFGRVLHDGEFQAARGLPEEVRAAIIAALDALNAEAIAIEVVSAAETA